MNFLTKEDLQNYSNHHDTWCVSIYMPTIEKGQEVRQNPIRFKNLLDQAASQLKIVGMDNAEIEEFFEPARAQLLNEVIWQHQGQGLAVFFTKDLFQTINLPIPVEEQVVVNHRFSIKPLLPLLYNEGEFFILALSQNEVRLIKATEHTAEVIEVPNMPKNMDEALGYDNLDEQQGYHTKAPPVGQAGRGSGERQAIFFGHGNSKDNEKDFLLNYFRMVNKRLVDFLGDRRSPLVLAGVESHLPIYQEANTYQHLLDAIIPGNPEDVRAEDLRDKAWPIVQPLFDETRVEIVGRYKQLAGWKDQRAAKDLKEVIKAAPYGRVEVLFVDKNAKQWGTFDANNIEVHFEDEQHPKNQDLIDFAAVQTLLNGGIVYAVEPEELPDSGSPVAAIFRY